VDSSTCSLFVEAVESRRSDGENILPELKLAGSAVELFLRLKMSPFLLFPKRSRGPRVALFFKESEQVCK
jgi:hypothetical protein